ncbi:alkaline phosphatase [Aciduricibacillus chroicocephali]|uniref:Alkaline phosphatase n=1 Tax=Aciduricibacillus chroicocephali TaxID=3054939 RepID=A0ABY9KUF6_9BACI|nr:alkaline phosphatase [Bacillaceae bacterium 44XB]
MRKSFKKAGVLALVGTAAAVTYAAPPSESWSNGVAEAKQLDDNRSKGNGKQPKNVILLIGDGMGPTQVSAASYLKGDGFGTEDLTMNTFKNIGFARTFSHDNTVTDSAAAATAFSSSHKTDNNVIGLAPEKEKHEEDEDHFEVATVLEEAEDRGKATGLVTTTRITHATPAAFASHIDHRDKENEIAVQMLKEHEVDVLLGGGKGQFLPKSEGGKREDGLNLLKDAEKRGYTIAEDAKGLEKAKEGKLLGLFNTSHMNYELDRDLTKEPSLAEMTEKAIDVVSKEKEGFFLMVEGGRIDHAAHVNYPASTMRETLAFDDAVKVAKEFAERNKDTLVIVSADHETGGMSIGAGGTYGFNKDIIRNVTRSAEYMGKQVNKEKTNIPEVMEKFAGIKDLKEEEIKRIADEKSAADGIAKVISNRALIGWTTTGHTGVDVPVYAFGPQADKLTGTIDNTKIAEVISEAVKGKQQGKPVKK